MNRRDFLKESSKGLCAVPLLLALKGTSSKNNPKAGINTLPKNVKGLFEARHYEKLSGKKIKCVLCPRECQVADIERGYCGGRENQGGTYYSLVYGKPCSINIDPIEKKPLFHFRPGTTAFSLATAGCNMECKFCQNWDISQMRPEQVKSVDLPPAMVVKACKENSTKTIAFTYTEPVISEEYVVDTAIEGNKQGISTVIISNGYIQKKPLDEVCKLVPAIKIDLKGFTEKFYKETCSGELKPVLDSLIEIKKNGVWLELVVLIVPGLNDSTDEAEKMTKWIRSNLGSSVPIHFTRFHPMYKIKNLPSTPVATLEKCREIGMKNGLDFVYIGNVPGHEAEHTYCPKCKKKIIERYGYTVTTSGLKNGTCGYCKEKIPGVWS